MRKLGFAFVAATAVATAQAADPAGVRKVPSADGVSIAYEIAGPPATDQGGPALVLVHGWSCDRGYWKEQVEYLGAQYPLVLVDLAGHGQSGSARQDYTMASFGADVAAVVDALKLRKVVLVGHSMGSDVAVEAARLLPGRVAGLVWVDQYQSLDDFHDAAAIEAFIAKFRKDFRGTTGGFVRGMFPANADPKLVDRVANDMASAPPAVAISALRNTLSNGPHVVAALATIKLPVVAINADQHPTDHASLTKHGVKAFVVPDSGHFLMMEDPPRFNRSLDSVVKGFAR
jgi:pimeloyl-ACP methyl ester carboxylesterase